MYPFRWQGKAFNESIKVLCYPVYEKVYILGCVSIDELVAAFLAYPGRDIFYGNAGIVKLVGHFDRFVMYLAATFGTFKFLHFCFTFFLKITFMHGDHNDE